VTLAEKIKYHTKEGRRWAEAADREAAAEDFNRGRIYAEVSQAHSFAALATVLAEGSLTIDGTVMHP
jgi:hypothetical protein